MQKSTSTEAAKNLTNVIKINEDQFKNHLGEMVRSTVEETLNDMLDVEADQLCNAQRYERTEARTGGRAGHYKRKLHTTSGEVELKVPKLRLYLQLCEQIHLPGTFPSKLLRLKTLCGDNVQ